LLLNPKNAPPAPVAPGLESFNGTKGHYIKGFVIVAELAEAWGINYVELYKKA
jgi:hypothetical protein